MYSSISGLISHTPPSFTPLFESSDYNPEFPPGPAQGVPTQYNGGPPVKIHVSLDSYAASDKGGAFAEWTNRAPPLAT